MKSETEIKEEYENLLDIYGHLTKTNYLKKKTLGKIEALEWVLNIQKDKQ